MGTKILVKQRGKPRWPAGCPERHIESDGAFCLGVGAPIHPHSAADADTWWVWLKEFLDSQIFVDSNRYWPSGRTLHHGQAAHIQIEMEELSRGTFLENDVRRHLEEGDGWLSQHLPRLSKDGRSLINLRSPCPVGCFTRTGPPSKIQGRKKHAVLRRDCQQKTLLLALVKLELIRLKKENEFWQSHPRKTCCKSIVGCPLDKAT